MESTFSRHFFVIPKLSKYIYQYFFIKKNSVEQTKGVVGFRDTRDINLFNKLGNPV